ncbi:ParB N-terminal domain-containing protein [Microbacterium oxydans]|uniref:ParB N-terminal domain-containing protein n=1 Tax=Microbacterium oxydans TaxID=82380 RepID=UPI00226B2F2E|nr:ParB N-terminal domain-containing protein [Microbacterium oxydans]WAA66736.1 hypothetical protein MME74_03020 [Microbacterium oxydans]
MADSNEIIAEPLDELTKRSLEYLPVAELLLDTRNPRLVTSGTPTQEKLMRLLYETESLDELAASFADNGYFAEEPLVVVPDESGWVVVEGNRRLTTLKILLSSKARASLGIKDWPELTPAQRSALELVPCVKYEKREDVFPFLGFRHITGPKKWAPFQRARFIAQLIDDGKDLSEIEDLVGDTGQTVKKLYQDYVVFEQVKKDLDLPERPIRERFSLLEVTLGQRSIKTFLNIPRRLPVERVDALVPDDHLDQLEEVVTWVFGSEETAPVISDSRAITNRLAPVLASETATAYLRKTGDLEAAYEFSDGEKAYLLKRVQSAERALRDVASLISIYRTDDDIVSGVARLAQVVEGLSAVVDAE